MARKSTSGRKALAFGTIATATILAGCDQPPPDSDFAFQNVAQCRDAGFEQQVCETKLNEAVRLHAEAAPKFASREACEAEHGAGNCGGAQNASGGSFFTPFLAGFLMSRMVGNVGANAYRTGNGFGGGPIYRSRSGAPVAIPPAAAPGARSTPRPLNASTRSAARSGFGGRSFQRAGRGFGG